MRSPDVLLSTVHHTGTHTLNKALTQVSGSVNWTHCGRQAVKLAKSGKFDYIATTLRDPYDVALSWLKKRPAIKESLWREQWECWGEIAVLPDTRIFIMPGQMEQHGIKIEGWYHHDTRDPNGEPPIELVDYAKKIVAEIERTE